MVEETVRAEARRILEAAWDDFRGYSFPHETVYAHLWLWDSCFHSIAWASFGDDRARRELEAVFAAQLPNGFVPHMRYAAPSQVRGPLAWASSYTQPPVYGEALGALEAAGLSVPAPLVAHIDAGFEYLWRDRRRSNGLLSILHPWEAGADDSPRWDSWIGTSDWNRPEWTAFDVELVSVTEFGPVGDAVANPAFEAAPAAFNAIAADGMRTFAEVSGIAHWNDRASQLCQAIETLWNDDEELWSDRAVEGGGPSVHIPTLDGTLPALVSSDEDRARRALDQLADPNRFHARYGLAYVAQNHPTYRGDLYWRGAAWPQLNYLAHRAAVRWGRTELAADIAAMTLRGARESGFSELWDPQTGEARGATPQTWAALAAVFT